MAKSKFEKEFELQQKIHRKLEKQYHLIMGRTFKKIIPHTILLVAIFMGFAMLILQIPYDLLRAIAIMGNMLLFTLIYAKIITIKAKKETDKYLGSPEWEEEWKDM
jgi:hypothetical protein